MSLTSFVLIGALFSLLGIGMWIGLALLLVGILGMVLFTNAPTGLVMLTTIWGSSTSWTLTALPLFIWMGEILFRSRLSEDLFSGLAPWMSRIPGRLLHVNIIGCAVFAAVCGSSAATSAAVGKFSLPELKQQGYDESLSIGTLAGSGTFGLMIPPSIMLIVYGVAAEVSIAKLFVAGALPGLMLVILFMGYVIIRAKLRPSEIPDDTYEHLPFVEKLERSRLLIPLMVLIFCVIGSIYSGIATATEAAAVGVVGALILAVISGGFTFSVFVDSLKGAMITSCMITFILACAAFLANALGFTGLPAALAGAIGSLELSPAALLVALTVFYILLGCFLDGISIVVLTTSIIMPLIQAYNIDLIWFGIYIVLVSEMGQITPPVGFNLFVLQSMTGRDLLSVARSTMPFFFLLVLALVIIAIFPQIATFLPARMSAH
ncbi:MAG: TRAP transporter large permease subunit [Nitratireductor sp.]